MTAVFDAFWRAAGYCLHPRVILVSLLPLLLAGTVLALLGYAYWEPLLAAVRGALERWSLVAAALAWVEAQGAPQLRTLLAPMIVVALAIPLVVVLTLLLVTALMLPAIVELVAARRFPALQRRHGASRWQVLLWALACSLAALLALAGSIPLWLVPPLVLLVPPLIWGWLAHRVLGFGVLAQHAAADERRAILRRHRWPLAAMGVVAGLMGALPSMLWGLGAATLIFAPLLMVLSVWLYLLVFSFAAAWFAHYALDQLQRLRGATPTEAPPPADAPAIELHP
jgi:hypothetical protein